MEMSEKNIRAYALALNEANRYMMDFLHPIIAFSNGTNKLIGTSIFIRHSNRFFCLTAKHVIESARKFGELCIGLSQVEGGAVIALKSDMKICFSDDGLDVAIFEIPDENKREIQEDLFFTVERFEYTPNDAEEEKTLAIIGCQCQDSVDGTVSSKALIPIYAYGAFISNEKPRNQLGKFSKDKNFCMEYGDENNVDERLRPASPLSWHGMSGGPVLNIFGFLPKSEIWYPERMRFYGMVHEYFPDQKIIVGTNAAQILKFLKHKFPDLDI
jgi:hypothetical protein